MKENKKSIMNLPKVGLLLIPLLLSHELYAAKYGQGEKTSPYGELGQSNIDILDSFFFDDRQKELFIKDVAKEYESTFNLIKQKKYEQAKEKITLLIKKNPKQSVYYNLRGILYMTENDLIGAGKSFKKSIEFNPKNVQAYVALSKLELANKQYQQAKWYADKALQVTPHAIIAYSVLADVAAQQSINEAEKVLLKADEKVKGNLYSELEVLKLLAKVYAHKEQPQKMLDLVANLVKRYPAEMEVHAALASIQLATGNMTDAEKTLRYIVSQQPENSHYLFLLARFLGGKPGYDPEVLKLLDKALVNLELPALVNAYKVSYLVKYKYFKLAIGMLEGVLAQDKDIVETKFSLAGVYQSAGDYGSAIRLYEEVRLKKKDNAILLNNLAWAYSQQNNQKKALELSEIAFKKAPELANIIDTRGYILLNNGYKQESLNLLKRAFELSPKSNEIKRHLAEAYIANQYTVEARKILQQLIDQNSSETEKVIKLMRGLDR